MAAEATLTASRSVGPQWGGRGRAAGDEGEAAGGGSAVEGWHDGSGGGGALRRIGWRLGGLAGGAGMKGIPVGAGIRIDSLDGNPYKFILLDGARKTAATAEPLRAGARLPRPRRSESCLGRIHPYVRSCSATAAHRYR